MHTKFYNWIQAILLLTIFLSINCIKIEQSLSKISQTKLSSGYNVPSTPKLLYTGTISNQTVIINYGNYVDQPQKADKICFIIWTTVANRKQYNSEPFWIKISNQFDFYMTGNRVNSIGSDSMSNNIEQFCLYAVSGSQQSKQKITLSVNGKQAITSAKLELYYVGYLWYK